MFPALERVFEATECQTQVQLAAFFAIRQSSIAVAKRRNAIPAEWLIKLLRVKGINPDWVLSGEGPKFLNAADIAEMEDLQHVRVVEVRPPEECTSQELVNELVRRALSQVEP